MKKILSIIMSVLIIFGLAACGNKTVVEKPEIEKEVAETENMSKQKVQVTIFDVAENTDYQKELELENPSPANIANAILAELGATKTKINSVAEINNEIFVDFSADSEVLHSGTAGETAVLDSLGFTFVGNLKYDHIYFTVDGEKYESGHIALEIDEPYM